ncbi:MAG: discoidin domain-containing protein, partial [Candidatus Omnitrophica bacterium]|nr:discoidin domain-containing protein [Candidatus Omnitrophota bacterium]
DSLALTKKTDVSRLRLITNENVNAGYRIEVTEDGVTWKTVVDKTTGGLKREWQDYEFEAKGIQRLRIVPVGYGSIEIQELQIFSGSTEEKNFLFSRDYDTRGNITSESNILYEIWQSRPELKIYFPDPGKKSVIGRWKGKTIADWAREEGWLEDPRLEGYRPQEESLTPELKDAFDSRKDLQARFTETRFDNDTGLGYWAERFGSVLDPRLAAYDPGRSQEKAQAEGIYSEQGLLGENLARGAQVITSSQLPGNYHKNFAIDGRKNTRWLSQTYTAASSDTEFFTLDLGAEISLGQIRVDTGAEANVNVSERVRRFSVSISTDGVTFTKVKDIEGLLYPGWVTANFSGQKARFIKLHAFDTQGAYYAAIAEVEVYAINQRTETTTEVVENGIRKSVTQDEIGVVLEEHWDLEGRKIYSKSRSGASENLALGRAATSSSNYNQNFNPALAVDGMENRDRSWVSGTTNQAEWIQVDLGSLQNVSKIRLNANHPDYSDLWLSSFTLEVSSDGTDWQEIGSQREVSGYIWNYDFSEQAVRYVRVKDICAQWATGNDYYAFINELEVFGRSYEETWVEYQDLGSGITSKVIRDKKGVLVEEHTNLQGEIVYQKKRGENSTNVARGKAATASNYYNESFRPGRAVDGQTRPPNANPYGAWIGSPTPQEEWWQLDLGRLEKFSHLLINTQYETSHTRQFRLQVSKDGITWDTLAEEAGLTQGRNFNYEFSEQEARFVKIDRIRGADSIQEPIYAILGEVEVYANQYEEQWREAVSENGNRVTRIWADAAKTVLVSEEVRDDQGKVLSKKERVSLGNLARGAKVTSSSYYNSNYAAWKATDGLYSASGMWASEYRDRDEWLQVDLGRSVELSKVLIDTQGTAFLGDDTRVKDFRIQISEDGINWISVAQETDLSWHGTFEYKFLPKRARYIRVDGIHGANAFANYYAPIREIQVEATELVDVKVEEVRSAEGKLLKQIERSTEFQELSFGKTAWATTDNESTGRMALKALDGDPTTYWQGVGDTAINNAFVIDLEDFSQIDEVRVLTQFPAESHFVKSFRVSTSWDGVNWSVVAEPSGATGPQEWVVPVPPLRLLGFTFPRFARYVKIDNIEARYLPDNPYNDFLQEVRVFGRSFVTTEKEFDASERLIRETKTGSRNSGIVEYGYHTSGEVSEIRHYLPPTEEWRPLRFDAGGTTAGLAIIDGNDQNTAQNLDWGANDAPSSFTAKLENLSTVSKIRIFTAVGLMNGHSFTIDSSIDGVTWTRIVEKSLPGRGGWIEDEFPPIQAQYLRVTGHIDSVWGRSLSIYELEAYEKVQTADAQPILSREQFDAEGNLTSEANALFLVWEDDPELQKIFSNPTTQSHRMGRWFGKNLTDWAREEGYKHYAALQSYAPPALLTESGANREILPGLRQVLDDSRPLQDRFRKTGNKDSELIQYARNWGYGEDSRLFHYGPYGSSEEVASKNTFETRFDSTGHPSTLVIRDEHGRRTERRFNTEGRLVEELPELVLLWKERPELFKGYTDSSSLYSWATSLGYKDPAFSQALSDYSPYALGGQETQLPYLSFSSEIYNPFGFVSEISETIWNLSGGLVRTDQTFYNALGHETRVVNEQGDFSYTSYLDRNGRLIRRTDSYGNIDWVPTDIAAKGLTNEGMEAQIVRAFLLIYGRLPSPEELSREKRFIDEKGKYVSRVRLTFTENAENANFSSTPVGKRDASQVSYGGTVAELAEIERRAGILKADEAQTRVTEENSETKYLETLVQRVFRKFLGRDPREEGVSSELGQMIEKVKLLGSVSLFESFVEEEYNQDTLGKTEHVRRAEELRSIIDSVYNDLALFFGFSSGVLDIKLEALLKLLKSDPSFEFKELTPPQLERIRERLLELIEEDIHFGGSAIYALREMLIENCESANAGNPEGVMACKTNLASLAELTELALFSDILTGVIAPEFVGSLQFSAYTLKTLAGVSGLKMAGFKLSWEEFKAMVQSGYAVMTNIEERHFVVVTAIGADTVTLLENGITRTKSIAEFQAKWFGMALVDEHVFTDSRLASLSLATKTLSAKEMLKVKGAGWFKKLFKKIVRFFQKVIRAVMKAIQKVTQWITKALSVVFGRTVGRALAGIVNGFISLVTAPVHIAFYVVHGDWKGLLKYMGQLAIQVAVTALMMIPGVGQALGAVLNFVLQPLLAIGKFILGGLLQFAGATFSGLGQVFGSGLSQLGANLTRLGQSFTQSAQNFFQTGMKDLFKNLKVQNFKLSDIFKNAGKSFLERLNPVTQIKNLWSSAAGGIKGLAAKNGFSRFVGNLMEQLGIQIAQNQIDQQIEKTKMNSFLKTVLSSVSMAGLQGASSALFHSQGSGSQGISSSSPAGPRAPPANQPGILERIFSSLGSAAGVVTQALRDAAGAVRSIFIGSSPSSQPGLSPALEDELARLSSAEIRVDSEGRYTGYQLLDDGIQVEYTPRSQTTDGIIVIDLDEGRRQILRIDPETRAVLSQERVGNPEVEDVGDSRPRDAEIFRFFSQFQEKLAQAGESFIAPIRRQFFPQAEIDQLVKQGQFQGAIDFASKRFGFLGGQYKPKHPDFIDPSLIAFADSSNRIIYGGRAFFDRIKDSKGGWIQKYVPTRLQSVGMHESVHVLKQFAKNRVVFDQSVKGGIVNRYLLEMEAAQDTILAADKMKVSNVVRREMINYYDYN